MDEREKLAVIRVINASFRAGERLVVLDRYRGGWLTGTVFLTNADVSMTISWPSLDFCLFGKDDRVPGVMYTPLFDMVLPTWKFYSDVQKFAERNSWLSACAGCNSAEELALKIAVAGNS